MMSMVECDASYDFTSLRKSSRRCFQRLSRPSPTTIQSPLTSCHHQPDHPFSLRLGKRILRLAIKSSSRFTRPTLNPATRDRKMALLWDAHCEATIPNPQAVRTVGSAMPSNRLFPKNAGSNQSNVNPCPLSPTIPLPCGFGKGFSMGSLGSTLPTRNPEAMELKIALLWNVHHCQLQSFPPKLWSKEAPAGWLGA
jgi:hypothetical protein